MFDGNTRKEVEGRSIDAYSVFKKGIRPEWEDPANKTGGELSCRKTMTADALDIYWENLVHGLIGETIDDGDEICGARVADKSKKGNNRAPIYRLEVWTRTGNEEVGNQMKARLNEVLLEITDGAKTKGPTRSLDFEFKKR